MAIRKATQADAEALARLAESTFRDTFAADNTAADMEQHCRNSYSAALQGDEIANLDILTLLVEDGPRLLAFAQIWCAGKTPAALSGKVAEIRRFYVAREAHGQGVATQLMRYVLSELSALHFDAVWLGVWERHPRALAFYRKHGFSEFGEHVFQLGSDAQRDVLMVRSLHRR